MNYLFRYAYSLILIGETTLDIQSYTQDNLDINVIIYQSNVE